MAPQRKKKRISKKKNSRWLYVGLFFTLSTLLILALWSNESDDSMPNQQPVGMVASPPVVYEDLAAVQPHGTGLPSDAVHGESSDLRPNAQLKPNTQLKPNAIVAKHGMALIIDDVGYDLPALRRILALPFPTAISIIPEAPHAKEAAELAHQSGHVVMLHLPMEPANPHYRDRMDASFLRADMDEVTIRDMVLKALSRVPYAVGMNNHMGSMLTSLTEPMQWVMQVCREQGLFFIDSKTSSKSVAATVAENAGVVWGSRRTFLDHSIEYSDMQAAWQSGMACAKLHSDCIMIGHPHAETLDFLEQYAVNHQDNDLSSVMNALHQPRD